MHWSCATAALLCALVACLSVGASLHCAVRREISPCTCRRQDPTTGAILVACERMLNYNEVSRALTDRFALDTPITLQIAHSSIQDVNIYAFRDLGMSIVNLKLNYNNISAIDEFPFVGLNDVGYLSLADNAMSNMPKNVLAHLPNIRTLDLGRNKISVMPGDSFKDVPRMEHLVIAGNILSVMDKESLPRKLRHLHIGINHLSTLNGTLRHLSDLEWLFINSNRLRSIEGEIPMANKLALIHAANNQLDYLPSELRELPMIDSLYFYNNKIKALNGALQKSRRLERIVLSNNLLQSLSHDDFAEAERLADLDLGHNRLKVLNGSLKPLRSLRYLNLTHNELPEFSFDEIKGLKRLTLLDLSHNKISHLTGNMENLVDLEMRLSELRLHHNRLQNLGGALMGLHGLLHLNISHNLLEEISPDDLIGLDMLKVLDVSHNRISTLEETSRTFLPALEELMASHNNLTLLDKDFHGLPSLCWADLSYNRIEAINYELVTKTKCSIHDVLSTLKIYLQGNPVLCDSQLPELIKTLDSLDARLHGTANCTITNELVTTQLPILQGTGPLNDIIPPEAVLPASIILAQNLRQSISIVPLESQLNPASVNIFRPIGTIVGHIIPGRNGELPIIVEPPITLPPATTSTSASTPLLKRVESSPVKTKNNIVIEVEPPPDTIPDKMTK